MSQSAVALHIYRVGRSIPVRSRNPYKSRVKIQLLTRIGLFGPVWRVSKSVWPPLNRSDRGAGLPGGVTSPSGLQIGHPIYTFRSSWWDLRNGVVQLIIWQLCLDRSDWFAQIAQHKPWLVPILDVNSHVSTGSWKCKWDALQIIYFQSEAMGEALY